MRKCAYVSGRVCVCLRACLCVRQFLWACVRVFNCTCELSCVLLRMSSLMSVFRLVGVRV